MRIPDPPRSLLKPVAGFCYASLMLGVLLVGPVRWLTTALRMQGWEQRSDDLMMLGLIGLYVLGSACLALWIVRPIAPSSAHAIVQPVRKAPRPVGHRAVHRPLSINRSRDRDLERVPQSNAITGRGI